MASLEVNGQVVGAEGQDEYQQLREQLATIEAAAGTTLAGMSADEFEALFWDL